MSTYNIGFYEDLTKNIFQLSSNIIKYVAYLVLWSSRELNDSKVNMRKFVWCLLSFLFSLAWFYVTKTVWASPQ